jgi:hypothetical protein
LFIDKEKTRNTPVSSAGIVIRIVIVLALTVYG